MEIKRGIYLNKLLIYWATLTRTFKTEYQPDAWRNETTIRHAPYEQVPSVTAVAV